MQGSDGLGLTWAAATPTPTANYSYSYSHSHSHSHYYYYYYYYSKRSCRTWRGNGALATRLGSSRDFMLCQPSRGIFSCLQSGRAFSMLLHGVVSRALHTNYKDSGGTYTHGCYPFLWVVVEGEFAHKVCGLTVRSVAWDLS